MLLFIKMLTNISKQFNRLLPFSNTSEIILVGVSSGLGLDFFYALSSAPPKVPLPHPLLSLGGLCPPSLCGEVGIFHCGALFFLSKAAWGFIPRGKPARVGSRQMSSPSGVGCWRWGC